LWPWLAVWLAAVIGIEAEGQEKAAATATAEAPAPVPSAGLVNDWLRQQSDFFSPWNLGGQIRGRFENKEFFAVPNEGKADFQRGGDGDNSYFLLRERVHLGYAQPDSWWGVFSEMQDSRAYNDDRNPSPDSDHFELRQAWVGIGNPQQFPLTAKVGRQELLYGDQRLVGPADWLNIGRTFDAFKFRYAASNFWVDAFAAQQVMTDKHGFNASDDHDRLSGVYASTPALPRFQETQLYFLAHNVERRPPTEQNDKLQPLASPRDIYTIGARVKSLPGALGNWDYEGEAAGQFGRFKFSDTAPSLEQRAYAVHAAGGYTWNQVPWSPRLGLEDNYASGDGNANDRQHGTFDNLFPSNHGLYGIMDFFSWQNMQDLRASAAIRPLPNLTVKLDGYAFWLADTHDYFYQSTEAPRKTGGYGINPSAGNYVGSELDLLAAYALPYGLSVQGGYGHFFAGDYVQASLAHGPGARDADYLFAQVYFNF
jgi:hypothetical protein